MYAFPLVAAHLLDCNRVTWDPRAEDVAVLKAATRRARWRRCRSAIAVLLRLRGGGADRSPTLAVATAGP
jgi:hypothetical protein